MLGALDSQSLSPGSMLETEVCLSILSSSPESPKILYVLTRLYAHTCTCTYIVV